MTETIGTILLVDDEKVLRTLLRIALIQRRFQVLEAPDGRRALEAARRHSGPIHLLVTEVCLPRLDGLELARSLAEERPEMKAIFLARQPERLPAGPRRLLEKPFDLSLLLALVAEELGTALRKPPARVEEAAAARVNSSG